MRNLSADRRGRDKYRSWRKTDEDKESSMKTEVNKEKEGLREKKQ